MLPIFSTISLQCPFVPVNLAAQQQTSELVLNGWWDLVTLLIHVICLGACSAELGEWGTVESKDCNLMGPRVKEQRCTC